MSKIESHFPLPAHAGEFHDWDTQHDMRQAERLPSPLELAKDELHGFITINLVGRALTPEEARLLNTRVQRVIELGVAAAVQANEHGPPRVFTDEPMGA